MTLQFVAVPIQLSSSQIGKNPHGDNKGQEENQQLSGSIDRILPISPLISGG